MCVIDFMAFYPFKSRDCPSTNIYVYKKKIYKKFQYSEFVCDWNDGLNKTAVENDMSPAVSRKPIKFDSVFSSEWISFHLMCMCNCCSNDVLHEYKIVLFFFWIVWLGTYSMCQVAWCNHHCWPNRIVVDVPKARFFSSPMESATKEGSFLFPFTSHLFMSFIFEVQPMSPLKCSK